MSQLLSLPAADAPAAARVAGSWKLPAWPALLLLAALVYAAMPLLHHLVYGHERIAEAAYAELAVRAGAQLTEGGRSLLAAQFSMAPTWSGAVASFAATLITVVLAGVMMNMAAMLLSSEVTPAQALSAAGAAAAAVALTRVGLWALLLWRNGTDGLRGLGWLAQGSVNLSLWAPADQPGLVVYALYSADLTLLTGVLTAALVLSAADRRLSATGALLVALSWPLTVVAVRVALSAILHFPIG